MIYKAYIDAGGTSTKLEICDSNDSTIFSNNYGPGNIMNNSLLALENISAAISDISANNILVEELIIGISGYKNFCYKERFIKDIDKLTKIKFTVTDDLEFAFIKKHGYKNNHIIVICGTGSAILARNNDTFRYFGGWGHLLGDEGSAYSISISAIKQMIKEYESGEEFSEITEKIMDTFKLAKIVDIKSFVYNSDKSKIAELSKVIDELANYGSEKAQLILKREAIELGSCIDKALKFCDLEIEITLSIVGSTYLNSSCYSSYLLEYLKMIEQTRGCVINVK